MLWLSTTPSHTVWPPSLTLFLAPCPPFLHPAWLCPLPQVCKLQEGNQCITHPLCPCATDRPPSMPLCHLPSTAACPPSSSLTRIAYLSHPPFMLGLDFCSSTLSLTDITHPPTNWLRQCLTGKRQHLEHMLNKAHWEHGSTNQWTKMKDWNLNIFQKVSQTKSRKGAASSLGRRLLQRQRWMSRRQCQTYPASFVHRVLVDIWQMLNM